jgi:hypothetical protein
MVGRFGVGALAVVALVAACGGATSVEGSYGGIDYSMDHAYFVNQNGGSTVIVTSDDDFCRHVIAESPLFNVEFGVFSFGRDAPGSYSIADGTATAEAQILYVGACAHHRPATAVAGTLSLQEVDLSGGTPSHLVGSVGLTFPDGGTLNGPFDAVECHTDGGQFIPYFWACY